MRTINTFAITLLALAIAGCGGSSSSSNAPSPTPTPTPALNLSSLQGIWRSPAGAASTISAVVLPDGKLWALISSGSNTRVLKGAFDVKANAFAGSGKSFNLGTSGSSTYLMGASVVDKSTMSGSVTAGGVADPYSLAYQVRYDTAASLADFVGIWSANLGPGVVNWTINTAGVITGTRTTGCTYTGQLTLRAEPKAVVNAAVTETCAGTVTQLSGIAVKSEDKLSFSMLLTNPDDTAAVALSLAH